MIDQVSAQVSASGERKARPSGPTASGARRESPRALDSILGASLFCLGGRRRKARPQVSAPFPSVRRGEFIFIVIAIADWRRQRKACAKKGALVVCCNSRARFARRLGEPRARRPFSDAQMSQVSPVARPSFKGKRRRVSVQLLSVGWARERPKPRGRPIDRSKSVRDGAITLDEIRADMIRADTIRAGGRRRNRAERRANTKLVGWKKPQ